MKQQELKEVIREISEGVGDYFKHIDNLKKYGKHAIVELLNTEIKHQPGVRDGRDAMTDILGAISMLSKEKETFDFVLNFFDQELAKPQDQQKYVSSLAWALGGTGNQEADRLIAKCLNHKDKWIRWMACESLLKLKSERSIPALIDALKDRSEMVKITAITALKEFGTMDALPALKRLSESKRLAISEAAIAAIILIKKRSSLM